MDPVLNVITGICNLFIEYAFFQKSERFARLRKPVVMVLVALLATLLFYRSETIVQKANQVQRHERPVEFALQNRTSHGTHPPKCSSHSAPPAAHASTAPKIEKSENTARTTKVPVETMRTERDSNASIAKTDPGENSPETGAKDSPLSANQAQPLAVPLPPIAAKPAPAPIVTVYPLPRIPNLKPGLYKTIIDGQLATLDHRGSITYMSYYDIKYAKMPVFRNVSMFTMKTTYPNAPVTPYLIEGRVFLLYKAFSTGKIVDTVLAGYVNPDGTSFVVQSKQAEGLVTPVNYVFTHDQQALDLQLNNERVSLNLISGN
jgi:hypothetical protein